MHLERKAMFPRGFKSWCENTSRIQRKLLGIEPKDPLDTRLLAKQLGVQVVFASEVPGVDDTTLKTLTCDDFESWSAITLASGKKNVVILNPAHSVGRVSSDLAHELSHILLDHKAGRAFVNPSDMLLVNVFDKGQEEQADWLSGCLLLPREALILIKYSRMSDESAMIKYGVSREMLKYRLDMSGVNLQFRRVRHKRT